MTYYRPINTAQLIEILQNPTSEFIRNSNIGEIIYFENCSFESIRINKDIHIERNITFKNVEFKNVDIKGLKTTGFINFWDLKSPKDSNVNLEISSKDLTFNGDSLVESSFVIKNSFFENLGFSGGVFNYFVTVENNNMENFSISSEIRIKSALFIKKNSIKSLIVNGGEINHIYHKSGNTNYFGIYGEVKVNVAYITGGEIGNLKIDAEGLKKMNLKNYHDETGTELNVNSLTINNLENNTSIINSLNLKTIEFQNSFASKNVMIYLSSIMIEKLLFTEYINYGQINFNNISISNLIQFRNSDLGKVSFIGCEFYNCRLQFLNSKIIETSIIGSDFPTEFQSTSSEAKIEALSQIKKIYENRGSQKDALEYYSKEMNALDESLSWKEHKWDKLNLWFNKKSTNHGVDWEKGLFSTLTVSAFFFFV
ncbi:hypothetical protein EGI22_09285 [Lacihabitans sp. LS3-19]|uniref:hypothetical protein n=1 Tax=Lacihabitans sp. LS3-19 TaxID=2487335 RepID=UPI0020CEF9D6|nr:hypothetical protein [Lacihabitans sp. LS3-19]MCP9768105.1 hypothetical protein [Lacihabitans sp. LS3-19]